jgi:hypothetical protein
MLNLWRALDKELNMRWQPLLTVNALLVLAAVSNGQTTNAISNVAGFQRVTVGEGRNFVALPVIPSTLTLASLVGTNLPANRTESSASVVDFWNQTSQTLANRSWLSSNAGFLGWRAAGTFADNSTLPLDANRGFVVTIRAGQGNQDLLLTGFVATNAQTQVVQNNGDTLAGSTYPVPVALADSGLIASGFVGGSSLATSDTLRFFNPATQLFDQTIWYDSSAGVWRNADSSIATRQLTPGEAFVIRRGNWAAGSFTWANPIPAVLSQELP